MKITKLKSLILLPVFALMLSGCNTGGSSSDNPPSGGKQDPVISIALEDGKQFNVGEFVEPQITVVPAELSKTITYSKNETSLGSQIPTEVGDYKITVATEENDNYKAGSASKNFLIRNVPTLTFFYGDNNPLENGHVFDLNSFPEIYAKSSVEGATITYSYSNASGDALEAKPSTAGVYFITASVARTETIGSTSASISFELVSGSTVTPTVTFFYDGEEKCLESNWLDGGFATSHYDAADFDINKLTYTVNPAGTQYTEEWAFKELDAPEEVDGSIIAKPTANPLAPGIYTVAVVLTNYNVRKWAGFVINDNGGSSTTTSITFYYDGVEKCLESNWLDEGFMASHYDAADFDINKLTFSVTPAGTQYTESWSLKALDAPEEAEGSPIAKPTANPLAPGIYAITVSAGSLTKWAGFVINDNGQGGGSTPSGEVAIKFLYDDVEKCLESNWLDEGFMASHYDAADFDINKLTFSVTPAGTQYTESWSLKALDAPEEAEGSPIAKPTTNPLAPGIYAVTITAGSLSKWAGFVINDNGQGGGSTPSGEVAIKFLYDGVEKCLESNWLDEGYMASHYDAADFDINKLTFAVTPAGTQYTESWTLKALDAPEEAEGSPIAKPTSNPLAPGIYAVTITAGSLSRWAGFVINDNGQQVGKQDPTVKFFYDGAEVGISGSRWFYEGYVDSQFNASDFDINKFSYTVSEGADYSVSWTLAESPIAAPTANPLASGTYACTIRVNDSAQFNALEVYILFHIK